MKYEIMNKSMPADNGKQSINLEWHYHKTFNSKNISILLLKISINVILVISYPGIVIKKVLAHYCWEN